MSSKVLIIAYYWPPSNAAGTHRPLRFVRHLRQFGWEPVVLTAEPMQYLRFDQALIDRVPEGLEVVRAPHWDPWLAVQHWRAQRLAGADSSESSGSPAEEKENLGVRWWSWAREILRWMESHLYHPDYTMGWIRPAIKAALKHFDGNDFQAIYATGGPWSDFEIGYQLSKIWQIPLVLDFRDGWTITFNDFEKSRPAWAKRWDRNRLGRYLAQAQAVVLLHGTFAACYLTQYPRHLSEEKIHLIPNGFEPNGQEHPMPPKGSHLSIFYVGTLDSRRYDTFLSVLVRLREKQNLSSRVRVTFVGTDDSLASRMAREMGLGEMVRFLPTTPFAVVNRMMQASHALLLLGEKPMPGYEMFASSKIFQYLAVRRPILGILPRNEARQILERVGAGPVADVDSPEDIEAALLALLDAWETGTLHRFLPNQELLKDYSEPKLTEALTRALSGQAPLHPYRRGEASVPASLRGLGDGMRG
jgi:glycosyltransferase involved in cell wall biosynthesis